MGIEGGWGRWGVSGGGRGGGAPELIFPYSPSGSKRKEPSQTGIGNKHRAALRPRPPEQDHVGGRTGRASVKIRLLRSAFPLGAGSPEVRVIG